MTTQEVSIKILSKWLNGAENFNSQALMMMAICLGVPMKKRDVLNIVRAYCDRETENRTYGKRE